MRCVIVTAQMGVGRNGYSLVGLAVGRPEYHYNVRQHAGVRSNYGYIESPREFRNQTRNLEQFLAHYAVVFGGRPLLGSQIIDECSDFLNEAGAAAAYRYVLPLIPMSHLIVHPGQVPLFDPALRRQNPMCFRGGQVDAFNVACVQTAIHRYATVQFMLDHERIPSWDAVQDLSRSFGPLSRKFLEIDPRGRSHYFGPIQDDICHVINEVTLAFAEIESVRNSHLPENPPPLERIAQGIDAVLAPHFQAIDWTAPSLIEQRAGATARKGRPVEPQMSEFRL